MGDTWTTVTVGFGGVVVGGAVSYVASSRIVRLQRRLQEQYEIWIRLLNSYQDFASSGREMLEFADGPRELLEQALELAHRNLNNARTLDPYGAARVRRMADVLGALQTHSSPQDRARIEEELDAIFHDFYTDRHHKFARYE